MKRCEASVYSMVEKYGIKVYFGKTPQETRVFTPSGEEMGGMISIDYKVDANGDSVVPKAVFSAIINIISEKEKNDLIERNKNNGK